MKASDESELFRESIVIHPIKIYGNGDIPVGDIIVSVELFIFLYFIGR